MKLLSDALLYGILDLGYVSASDALRVASEMCAGGVDVLQIRAKGHPIETVEALGQKVVPITDKAGIPLIVNDSPELVPSIGAQGAHVGQDDRGVADARWRAGRSLTGSESLPLIGKSTHSLEQAVAAAEEGADYIGFGPLYPTPTKLGRPAIGLEEIRRVHELVRIPIFCIGGIKLGNLEEVLEAGARRVVIVSGILQATDISGYCRAVKERLLEIQGCGFAQPE